MSIKAVQDFVQGDSFEVKITHNPVVNLTSAVMRLTLSKNEDSAPALDITYNVPSDTDATSGIARIPVTSAESAAVPPGKYYVSIVRTLAGDTSTLVRTGFQNVGKTEVFKDLSSIT